MTTQRAPRRLAAFLRVSGCHVVDLGFGGEPSDLGAAALAGRVDLVCALEVLHRVREYLGARVALTTRGVGEMETAPAACLRPSG
jgi:hypothetical protein